MIKYLFHSISAIVKENRQLSEIEKKLAHSQTFKTFFQPLSKTWQGQGGYLVWMATRSFSVKV